MLRKLVDGIYSLIRYFRKCEELTERDRKFQETLKAVREAKEEADLAAHYSDAFWASSDSTGYMYAQRFVGNNALEEIAKAARTRSI